jgi:hypothetical protein
MTRDLLELGDWLHSQQVTHVTMESAGVYWKGHEGYPLTDVG